MIDHVVFWNVEDLYVIISDKHSFAFIHIPKCAGTSIRLPLTPFNSWKLAGPPWQRNHPILGLIDFGHIPLFVLRDHFRPEFEAVQKYWSFAVVRDPYTRFASSVSQRLRMYSNTPIQKRTEDDINSCIREVIDCLSRQRQEQVVLPPDYIHFQRQVDYIQVDGERIVDSIYTVDQFNQLLADVSRHIGQKLPDAEIEEESKTKNRTIVFRNDLVRHMIEASRPATRQLSKLMSERFK